MLFSGGEPLMRPDLPELAEYAVAKGMRAVISTNGTLITREKARIFKEIGLSYVGISLDGLEEVNDRFRGVPGPLTGPGRHPQLPGGRDQGGAAFHRQPAKRRPGGADFRSPRKENIPRVCFYHLVYAGRGTQLMEEDLDHAETRPWWT